MQTQTSSSTREMEIIRKNKMEILETINRVREMRNDFDVLISTLITTEERFSELEDRSIQIIQREK